ncbi:hypothetical protein M427DRAFT_425737 [Gonapodya prolifera JEL478]|uniref:Uncharacterized protein n=1 Tax=Gonapodya prolifera (strain JEL478) TaxID=1344416 RepID=A0A139A4C1_GONPJ|nr:hypothetical protein M427DRAFT_425737 [Gonapodya prolifera JEL478]|eukprot:KXS11641.1 hypothetical protein M427DRAFT_425737 [Gonapodya prolifera JEL478]
MISSIDNHLSVALARASRRLIHADDYSFTLERFKKSGRGGPIRGSNYLDATSGEAIPPLLAKLEHESDPRTKAARRMVLHRAVWAMEWTRLEAQVTDLEHELSKLVASWSYDGIAQSIGREDGSVADSDVMVQLCVVEMRGEHTQRNETRKAPRQALFQTVDGLRALVRSASSRNRVGLGEELFAFRSRIFSVLDQCDRDRVSISHELAQVSKEIDDYTPTRTLNDLWLYVPYSSFFSLPTSADSADKSSILSTCGTEDIPFMGQNERPDLQRTVAPQQQNRHDFKVYTFVPDIPCCDAELLHTLLTAYHAMNEEYAKYLEDARETHAEAPNGWTWRRDSDLLDDGDFAQSESDTPCCANSLRTVAHIVDTYSGLADKKKSVAPLEPVMTATNSNDDCKSSLHTLSSLPYSTLRLLLTERLKLQFPHKAKKELLEAEEWCKRRAIGERLLSNVARRWKSERRTMIADILKSIQMSNDSFLQAQLESRIRGELLLKRTNLHDRLCELRSQKSQQMAELREQDTAAAEKRKREEIARNQKERRRRQKDRLLVSNLKEAKALEQELQLKERKRHQKMEEQAEMLRLEYCRQRTSHRRGQWEQKLSSSHQKSLELQGRIEERERRLEALRCLVRPQVARDYTRLLLPTASSSASEATTLPPLHPLVPISTFNTREIFADPRARLAEMLQQCELSQSGYASHAFKRVSELYTKGTAGGMRNRDLWKSNVEFG